jgi:methanogenic corrinoid protein MtbC1
MAQHLVQVFVDLKEKEILRIVQQRLDAGEDPFAIMSDARNALTIIGDRFSAGEYFISELVYSGVIMTRISELVKPVLSKAPDFERRGKVVIGTVAGDIHDIGKNIVIFMLDSHGFEVHDLGVDVPIERFVEAVREVKPQVVGLSGFLTLTYDVMKETIEAIKEAGLRDQVRIMIGGGQMDDRIKDYVGADAYGPDAMAAVSLAKGWVGGK